VSAETTATTETSASGRRCWWRVAAATSAACIQLGKGFALRQGGAAAAAPAVTITWRGPHDIRNDGGVCKGGQMTALLVAVRGGGVGGVSFLIEGVGAVRSWHGGTGGGRGGFSNIAATASNGGAAARLQLPPLPPPSRGCDATPAKTKAAAATAECGRPIWGWRHNVGAGGGSTPFPWAAHFLEAAAAALASPIVGARIGLAWLVVHMQGRSGGSLPPPWAPVQRFDGPRWWRRGRLLARTAAAE